MRETQQQKKPLPTHNPDAVEETLRLYHAWLAVLLGKMNAAQVRVGVQEIKNALKDFKCTVAREGDDYVICMGEDVELPQEDCHAEET